MPSDTPLSRIVTHDDLDGVVSAALVSRALGIDRFFFTGPVSMQNGGTPTTESDVVCDLPCPVRVGLWFDHHLGNLRDLELRGVDPQVVKGRFAPAPSCARVVYEYYRDQAGFPDFLEETVSRTDRVDSFDYATMEEWRAPRPERLLADSIVGVFSGAGKLYPFLERLVPLLRDRPMEEVLQDAQVVQAIGAYRTLEDRSLKLMAQDTSFLPEDVRHEVAIVDLTRHNRKPEVIRGAAFILHPEALAVLLVQNLFQGGQKTNDLMFSMSLSFLMNRREHGKDIGEMMRILNIGDGHPGAASGRIACRSKDEMLKVKAQTLEKIISMWRSAP